LILGLDILWVSLCLGFFKLAIMARNPKKILTGHELNQMVKCEGSLLEGKEKNTI